MELMKSDSMIILISFLLFKNIFCEENITEITNKINSKMDNLPIGSTIYYSRNIKCIKYSSTSSFCLINDCLYKTVIGGQNYLLK